MAGDEVTVTQTYTDYVQAFHTLDPQAILPYCHVPCMFMPPQGVRVMTTPAGLEAFLARMMAGFKARGYARSEITHLQMKQMSDHVAFLSVSTVGYTTDGQELERLGETYILRKTYDGWKIVVATVHDPHTIY